MQRSNSVPGSIADSANPRPQRAQILSRLVQPLHKIAHAVRAGEDEPIVTRELRYGAIERTVICRWNDLDGRHLNHVRAQHPQRAGQRFGLVAGARDHDAAAEQQQTFVPVQLLAQLHYLAEDDGCGRLQPALLNQPRQRRESAGDGLLIRPRAPTHHDGRRLRRTPARHDLRGNLSERRQSHEDHQRLSTPNLVPINVLYIVPSDEGDHRSMIAVRERYAGVGGNPQRRGNTRHHFERNACVGERFGFLAPASENERISALEPHDSEAAPRTVNHHGANLFLRMSVDSFLLADVDQLGARWRETQQRLIRKVVVEDNVGALENSAALAGDQTGVAGSRAHQVHRLHTAESRAGSA